MNFFIQFEQSTHYFGVLEKIELLKRLKPLDDLEPFARFEPLAKLELSKNSSYSKNSCYLVQLENDKGSNYELNWRNLMPSVLDPIPNQKFPAPRSRVRAAGGRRAAASAAQARSRHLYHLRAEANAAHKTTQNAQKTHPVETLFPPELRFFSWLLEFWPLHFPKIENFEVSPELLKSTQNRSQFSENLSCGEIVFHQNVNVFVL